MSLSGLLLSGESCVPTVLTFFFHEPCRLMLLTIPSASPGYAGAEARNGFSSNRVRT